ncbi:formylglycine-generating enzyme family protein [Candidatus Thiothrix anitrata]|uniref:Formylglycine-generating enzyme family protein n=1 Tax=Candidatus Thiothrix anitrata TaxID=2823902 RepID=A0ABX7X9E6_9GAMM|nr:formylglycine-generating enzyme family protein [Candidatus Thiothrix anitrata]
MRQHTIFPAAFPESWASDWGEDEYGLWMGFTYKGVRQDFRWIEPGTFMMGSPKNEPERDDDETQCEVTLTEGFWLAETTVTQALWEVVMGDDPSNFKGEHLPVEKVSWEDAQRFITKMNGMKPELQMCLPTEAQWEYCCRAGTTTPFYFGEQINSELVNFDGNYPYNDRRKSEYRKQTVEVKSLPPNDWGLYEMHGNVWELCQDWYGDYPAQPTVDPQGEEIGSYRVLRGGSWFSSGRFCRSASRHHYVPGDRSSAIGFRLALGHRAVQSGQ